jgi:hypothetical protein
VPGSDGDLITGLVLPIYQEDEAILRSIADFLESNFLMDRTRKLNKEIVEPLQLFISEYEEAGGPLPFEDSPCLGDAIAFSVEIDDYIQYNDFRPQHGRQLKSYYLASFTEDFINLKQVYKESLNRPKAEEKTYGKYEP